MDEKILRQVQASISAKRVAIPYDEAKALALRARAFKADKPRAPDINSPDPWERILAEGVVALAKHVQQRKAAEARDLAPIKAAARTPQEERLIAGFEEILRFVDEHGRSPQHGEERDIFERLFAVRLDRLRSLADAHPLLMPLDTHGLLQEAPTLAATGRGESVDDDALLADLGVSEGGSEDDITQLRHVRSYEERKALEDIASRTPCADFERFVPLFERVEGDLKSGLRKTLRFGRDASVEKGNFFILGGQMAYVAEAAGDLFQRHRERFARALLAAGALQGRYRPTPHRR
ncbi:hypothetical protein G6F57_015332 [Rhizopus arrhizus]|nr:hypothetical protein G6F57_015332 [Rhizopus arrhizus]